MPPELLGGLYREADARNVSEFDLTAKRARQNGRS